MMISTYTGEKVQLLGQANVNVNYSESQYSLPLLVVPHGSCDLFGRNWLMHVKLEWKNVFGLNSTPLNVTVRCSSLAKQDLESILTKYY